MVNAGARASLCPRHILHQLDISLRDDLVHQVVLHWSLISMLLSIVLPELQVEVPHDQGLALDLPLDVDQGLPSLQLLCVTDCPILPVHPPLPIDKQ